MIVGEGIVTNSGGGSGVALSDVYVYGFGGVHSVVNNLFSLSSSNLTALKSGNYQIRAYLSASSRWSPLYVEGENYYTAAYFNTTVLLNINGTRVTSWTATSGAPSGNAQNPYSWSATTTQHLNANDVVSFTIQTGGNVTQWGGIIIRITEVE